MTKKLDIWKNGKYVCEVEISGLTSDLFLTINVRTEDGRLCSCEPSAGTAEIESMSDEHEDNVAYTEENVE